MSTRWRAFLFSVLIHGLFYSAVLATGKFDGLNSGPVLIDLSILETGNGSPQKCAGPSVRPTPAQPSQPKEAKPREKRCVKHPPRSEKKLLNPLKQAYTCPSEPKGPVAVADVAKETEAPSEEELPDDSSTTGSGTAGSSGFGGSGMRASGPPGPGVGEGTGGGIATYLAAHFTYIKEIIQENLSYPQQAKRMGWSGSILVSFVIMENGEAKDIKILKSTGHELLDQNVIETIQKVAPFPKPPVTAEVRVPITYRLLEG